MRKCRFCRAEIPATKDCTDQFQRSGFCSKDHYIEHQTAKGLAAVKRKKEAQAKEQRQDIKRRKEKIMSLSDWVAKAQTYFNRVVVLEDKPKGCISCGSPDVTDAGHFFHRGSKYRIARLTLLRANLSGQCRSCNSFKGGGNQYEYRLGFIARYGLEAFEALEEYKRATDRKEIPNLTIEDCKAVIEESKAKIKALR